MRALRNSLGRNSSACSLQKSRTHGPLVVSPVPRQGTPCGPHSVTEARTAVGPADTSRPPAHCHLTAAVRDKFPSPVAVSAPPPGLGLAAIPAPPAGGRRAPPEGRPPAPRPPPGQRGSPT